MSNYLISISKTKNLTVGTIHDSKSKLKVRAFNLPKPRFAPRNGEIRFFVSSGKKLLAFETKGYKKNHELLVLQMISWYCVYIGLFEAQIHSTLPA